MGSVFVSHGRSASIIFGILLRMARAHTSRRKRRGILEPVGVPHQLPRQLGVQLAELPDLRAEQPRCRAKIRLLRRKPVEEFSRSLKPFGEVGSLFRL